MNEVSEQPPTPGQRLPQAIPIPKTHEETLKERERLSWTYRSIHGRWEDYKGRYSIPMKLDENFVLVWWIRSGFQSNQAPSYYYEYVSNYGCIQLNVWRVDDEHKRIVVNEDLYTLGADGKTRGKGKQGLEAIHHILQSISDAAGYSVYDITTPNEASTPLLTETQGYRLFEQADEDELAPPIGDRDRERWDKMIASAKPYPSKIKIYTPSQVKQQLTERENREIDTILNVTMINRATPIKGKSL